MSTDPDRWRALWRAASCALVVLGSLSSSTVPTGLYPVYVDSIGLGEAAQSAVFAMYIAGIVPVLLLSMRGRLPVSTGTLAGAAGASIAGAVVMLSAGSPETLFAGRALQGVGVALASIAGVGAVISLGRRLTLPAVAVIGGLMPSIGAAIGPVLGDYLGRSAWSPPMRPSGACRSS
ncbi:hypothetical protein IFT73_00955 [Aeromicrobium sp. CFBP 8757]|uniref:hypothetical protein n=1 Tax=Aeromicrobium sp. CFBP 8757 TaxID=2775288 RepID=UPI001781708D|nr:hypothetical protein [Aeromicrobium sp. CFBP 8757]MBD8605407.1 hypothetical protein [Aeromicrobium sp. CFBP 8757]